MAPVTRASKANKPKYPLLGPVLVTGGCGFLGYHLVGRLLSDPECAGPVHVLDLDITRNTHPDSSSSNATGGVTYTQGSLADAPALSALLARLQPTVIFHTASPNATYGRRADFHAVNVEGTRTLLRLATESPHVRAVVYTSTLDIYADPPHRHVKETHPIWPDRPRPWAGVGEYDRTKAVAHRLVLAANTTREKEEEQQQQGSGSLKTAVIVPSHMWGLRDSQGLSLFFDTFADPKKPLWQVGRGDQMMSSIEVGNCAKAHILAAKALLSPPSSLPGGKVDGEAFNVTDGEDVSFWGHFKDVCTLIRHPNADEGVNLEMSVVPAWLMVFVAALVKWALLLLTWGYVEPPPMLTRNGVSWCTEEHTIDDSKARERLGYRPDRTRPRRDMLAESVEWERERRKVLEGGGQKTL